jgi:hypothetical protein
MNLRQNIPILIFFLGHQLAKNCEKKKNHMELRVFVFQFCCGPAIVHKRNEPNLATHRSTKTVEIFQNLTLFWWPRGDSLSKYDNFLFFSLSKYVNVYKKIQKIQKNPLCIVHWISFCHYGTKIHTQKKGTSDFFFKKIII